MNGLFLTPLGEIIILSKYRKGYHELFTKLGVNKKYNVPSNFDMYCYLQYSGLDAQQIFLEKIRELEL